jgi:predicted RNase H-like HicB family nuclease
VFWSNEDDAWVADVPDLEYCSATGDTPHEAVCEVEVAIEAWLASIIHRPVAVSRGASAKVPAWYGKIDLLEINTQYQEGHLESEV